MRWLLIALVALPAAAEDVGLIDACIGPYGEPDEHAEWCKGVVAESCFYRAEDRSKEKLVSCIEAEVTAWTTILERELAALTAALRPEQAEALAASQAAWETFLAADCAFPPTFTADEVAESWASDCRLHHAADRALDLRGYRDFGVDPDAAPTLVEVEDP